MGTSQSSTGPGAGVSLVPPWADESLAPSGAEGQSQDGSGLDDQQPMPTVEQGDLAPPRRFMSTRRHLGQFAKTGDKQSLKAGVGHYISSGYGGSKTFSRRMAGTANTAWSLGRVLDPSESGTSFDRTLLSSSSANQIMDAVVEAVRSHDGTQDAESGREAVREALTELLTRFPDADLLDLTDAQREFVLEKFVVNDVFNRFQLDVGKHLLEKAPTPAIAAKRMQEVKDYMAEVIAESFRNLAEKGAELTSGSIVPTVNDALVESCRVFEEYTE